MINEKIAIQVSDSPYQAQLITFLHEQSPEIRSQKRPMVLICPGGGYAMTSDREAEPIALNYVGMGFHAAVLRYGVAPARYPEALLQLASAVALLRKNAENWCIDPNKIIVQGFSAGGHLAASLGVFWKQPFLTQELGVSADVIRPNGLLLGYPVISSGPLGHQGSFENLLGEAYADPEKRDAQSLEKWVSKDTPPTFLWHTAVDETVPVENSVMFFKKLHDAGVSAELHIFPDGPHGLALATEETDAPQGGKTQKVCASWIELAENWIRYSIIIN